MIGRSGALMLSALCVLLLDAGLCSGQAATLDVLVEPPMEGVTVLLLGRRQTRQTNREGVARFSGLMPGRYTVSARAGNGQEASAQAQVSRVGISRATLRFPFSRILVNTTPGARVDLDGSSPQARSETANRSGLASFDYVTPGSHEIQVRLSGYQSRGPVRASLGAGGFETFALPLSPVPEPEPEPPSENPVGDPGSEQPSARDQAEQETGQSQNLGPLNPSSTSNRETPQETYRQWPSSPVPGPVQRRREIPSAGAGTPGSASAGNQIQSPGPLGLSARDLLVIFGSINTVLVVLLVVVVRRRKLSPVPMDAELVTGRFDQYLVVAKLGRGGMATVYRARLQSGEWVAVKVMDPELRTDQDLLTKFLREGRVLQTINERFPYSPVVKVHRYGLEDDQEGGRPFIVMEYLEGVHLLEFLRAQGGRLEPKKAVEVVSEIAKGLEAAHACGVFHRDLTPDNIILLRNPQRDGLLRLIDFGVAKHEFTSVHTLDGSIFGKPPYMAPEQCRGGTIDGRTDLYSLGVVFYLLLSGVTPFADRNPLAVMKMHETAPIPTLPSDVHSPVASIVYRLLEKSPEARYQSATELISALSVSVHA